MCHKSFCSYFGPGQCYSLVEWCLVVLYSDLWKCKQDFKVYTLIMMLAFFLSLLLTFLQMHHNIYYLYSLLNINNSLFFFLALQQCLLYFTSGPFHNWRFLVFRTKRAQQVSSPLLSSLDPCTPTKSGLGAGSKVTPELQTPCPEPSKVTFSSELDLLAELYCTCISG